MTERPAKEKIRRHPGITSSVPEYRVLEIEGVTILTASMALDAIEPNIL